MASVHQRRETLAACLVLGLLLAWLAVPAISLGIPTPVGTIAGVVSDTGGVTPLGNIGVSVYDASSTAAPQSTAYTDSGGNFRFAGLRAGHNYYLSLWDAVYPYQWAPQYYQDHYARIESSTPIPVIADATTSVDPTMTLSATLAGTVCRLKHPSVTVQNATVDITWMGENPDVLTIESGLTGATGGFTLRGLHPGPWMLWVDMAADSPYADSAWATDYATLLAGDSASTTVYVPLKPVSVSNYPGGWVKEGYHFNPSVTDGDLPPFTTYSRVGDGGASIAGFNLSEVASQAIAFWSVDASGNAEATKTCTVHVDGSAPVTTCDEASGSVVAMMSLEATDTLSGVAATYYRIDGGAAHVYTGAASLPAGTHDVSFWSVDAVGNVEAASVLHAVNPPAIKLGKPNCDTSVKRNANLKVSGVISPKQKKGDRTTVLWTYRWVTDHWLFYKAFGTTSIRSRGTSRYVGSVKLNRKGKWRIIAFSPGTYVPGYWAGQSAAKMITVK